MLDNMTKQKRNCFIQHEINDGDVRVQVGIKVQVLGRRSKEARGRQRLHDSNRLKGGDGRLTKGTEVKLKLQGLGENTLFTSSSCFKA